MVGKEHRYEVRVTWTGNTVAARVPTVAMNVPMTSTRKENRRLLALPTHRSVGQKPMEPRGLARRLPFGLP